LVVVESMVAVPAQRGETAARQRKAVKIDLSFFKIIKSA